MHKFDGATFVTTTSYGSWLPGDPRGYVERGEMLPRAANLEAYAKQRLASEVVVFTRKERQALFRALAAASSEFAYHLSDATIEATHVHWIVAHDDPIAAMVGRLKARMRQTLGRGRIWTRGYSARRLPTARALESARTYIAAHAGAVLIDGVPSEAPGSTGG
jgi:hypothetical protein